jgi:hypothetical protein
MCRIIVLTLLLQYLSNADNLINSWSVMSMATPMIPYNYVYVWD